ncbi:hypothetical protein THAOC_24043, partial [Thalassiosira oceanica]
MQRADDSTDEADEPIEPKTTYRTEPDWGGRRGGTTAWSTVFHGSSSDDTTYPPDGVTNQDNHGGRTGVCAPRTCLPANVNSRLYPMDLTLEYGTVTVFVRMMRMCQLGRRREDEPFSPGQSQYSGGDENKIRFCRAALDLNETRRAVNDSSLTYHKQQPDSIASVMKFPVLVFTLFASSVASASAADINGYTGSDYTFVGDGHCWDGFDNAYSNATPLPRPFTLDECATYCQSFSSLDGQVGFDTNPAHCFCRYTDGSGPVSATTEEGLSWNTDAAGAIRGTDGASPTNQNICYRRNGFGGAYIGAYTGSDFTFKGQGYCAPEGSTTRYSHATPLGFPGVTMDECAAHCLGFPNTEGLVGMEGRSGDCLCLYIDGTGPESATTEAGISYNTAASGPVGGTDGSTDALCWTYNWSFGN